MFLDDIVNPLNELSKDQLKKYIKANAADAVQRTSSDSFKSGAAGDKYNKSEFDTPVDRKRERGMDRALNKLAREDSNDFSAVDSTSPIHGGLEEDGPMSAPAPGAVGARAQKDLFATPQQFVAQQTNLKAGNNAPVQWKKLTPTTAQELGIRVDAQYVAAPNGGITIKGLATSYENKTQFPFAMTIDADHQIRYKNVEKLNDDELDAVFQNLASNGLLDRQYINPLKAQLAEDKKSEVEKHAKDQEYVRNDPILHYGGNIAGVKSAVKQAKKKHPTAKNDVEAMFAQIGDEGDINQSQEQLLQKHKRVINQLTQQVTQLGAENQEQTDMITKLSDMLRQTPAAPSQQVAQKQQGLGEESKPRLTRIHYFNVDQPSIAQEIGLKQDRGGNWCLYQFDTSGAGFDRKFTQASRVFGRPTHSQAVAEDAFHSDEVGNSWSDGQGQWSSGNNQISSGNNPQGFGESDDDLDEVAKSDFRNRVEQQQLNVIEKIKKSDHPNVVKQYLIAINDPVGPVFKAAYRSFSKGQDAKELVKNAFAQKYNINPAELEQAEHTEMARALHGRGVHNMEEGFQDFNKVEPYEVCLAGKPVKTFDYYEDARRFHDNWKKKLYNQGDKAKADKITLNPILKEMDKSQKGAAGWNIDDYPLGAKGTTVKPTTRKKVVKDLTKVLNKAFDRTAEPEPSGVYKKNEFDIKEAGSPAQQAAIAIAMKKAGKKPKQVDELSVDTLKSYANKRGAQVAAMKADNPEPAPGSPEWVQQAVPAQQVNLAKRKIARKERQPSVAEGGFGRDEEFLNRERNAGLETETNNVQISINGRPWKVVAGKGYADSREERANLENMKRWAEKKSATTGKKWTVTLTGAQVSESVAGIEEGKMKDLAYDLNQLADHEFREKYGTTKQRWRSQAAARRPMSAELAKSPHIQKMNAVYGKPYSNLKDMPDDLPEGSMKDVYTDNQDAVYAALTRRVIGTEAGHLLIQNYGLDRVMDAMREVADFHGDVEEIGSSDVSAYMRQLQRTLESNR
jgi:hypothetical protein